MHQVSAYRLLAAAAAAIMSLLATFSAASAASPDLTLLRKAGSYVLLLDAEGRPIVGNYWLAPEIKIRTYSSTPGGMPNPAGYLDRDFFGGRRAIFTTLVNVKDSFTLDPASVAVGQSASVTRTSRQVGRFGKESEPRKIVFKYTAVGLISEQMSGLPLVSRIYEIEPFDLTDTNLDWGRRVYIETLDLDLSREQAAQVASVETGQAGSSGDFLLFYMIKANIDGAYTRCLEETRASPDFKRSVERQRETNDRWMATGFLTSDIAWWEPEGDDAVLDAEIRYWELCQDTIK
jgi:hypothetical protein